MKRSLGAAALATLCIGAATPPTPFPGGEWLVLPGLALLYAVASEARRPYLLVFLIGAAQFLWMSWSLRHVTVVGTIGITLLAGVYSMVFIAAWTRAGARIRLGGVWFGLGVAGFAWLRTHQPEIPYPHGQPVHALWQWPGLLAPLRLGGEPLGNLLLAWLAAGGTDLWRSWRVARPSRLRAFALIALAVGGWVVSSLAGWWTSGAVPEEGAPTVRVVAIQPGPFGSLQDRNAFRRWTRERLAQPTGALAGPSVEDPPDLVVWPESTLPQLLSGDPVGLSPRDVGIRLHERTSLVAGAVRDLPDGTRVVAAVQIGGRNQLLGWHEKRVPVPGGERLPFAQFLPESWKRALVSWGSSLTQDVPDLRAGEARPPLRTVGGVPFAALTCYDNAFEHVMAEAVAAGAGLVLVLSNEAWYRQGAELDQMVAMTVCRAIETATPLVRSTIDGATLAVDGGGRVIAEVPRGTGPEILDVRVRIGPGVPRPLGWLPSSIGILGLLAGLLLAWLRTRSSGRLASAR